MCMKKSFMNKNKGEARNKSVSEANLCVRFDGAASLPHLWANTLQHPAVIKFFKEGLGENFFQKIVSQWYA